MAPKFMDPKWYEHLSQSSSGTFLKADQLSKARNSPRFAFEPLLVIDCQYPKVFPLALLQAMKLLLSEQAYSRQILIVLSALPLTRLFPLALKQTELIPLACLGSW